MSVRETENMTASVSDKDR